MPEYDFQSTKTGEVQTVFLGMNDPKIYNGPKGDQPGLWRRLWSSPQAARDIVVDCHSSKDFVRATNKKGTVGDLWDRAKEQSLRRMDKDGIDNHKTKFYDNFSKKHKGTKHSQQLREESASRLAKVGVKVDWGND